MQVLVTAALLHSGKDLQSPSHQTPTWSCLSPVTVGRWVFVTRSHSPYRCEAPHGLFVQYPAFSRAGMHLRARPLSRALGGHVNKSTTGRQSDKECPPPDKVLPFFYSKCLCWAV